MNVMHRKKIRAAFSSADEYDGHARVQRVVANNCAARIAALPLPPRPRILEIGCGTGFLTEAIIAHGISADWLITDISADMVDRCRARVGAGPNRRFATLDGEYGEPEDIGCYDLICSSLAMQWFDDLDRALERTMNWLAPGGHCLFTTLASDSFAEWRAAHTASGLEPGTPEFLTVGQLTAIQAATAQAPPEVGRYVERHDSALDFMRCLKAIGAHTAKRQHRPLPPPQMRQVMRNFEQAGAAVTYEVATCHYLRPLRASL